MKCVITGGNHVFEENAALDCLPTLRRDAKFDGRVVFLDYGCTPAGLAKIKKYADSVVPCQLLNNNFTYAYNHRNEIVLEVMDDQKCDQFMFCCSGDLWFQRPLDELWGLVRAGVGHVHETWKCDGTWFQAIVAKLPEDDQRRIRDATSGKLMFNSGVVAGERSQMHRFLTVWHRHIVGSGACQHFGPCQVYANYLAAVMDDVNFVYMPRTFNYMPQIFPFWTKGNTVFDASTGEAAHIGHNAGQRLVARIYNGIDINKRNVGNYV